MKPTAVIEQRASRAIVADEADLSRRGPGRPPKYPAVVEFDCDGCETPSSQPGWVYHRGTSPLHFCATCAKDGTANRVRNAARIAERRRLVTELYPEHGPTAIAKQAAVSKGTVHSDIDALVREGVLERVPQWPAREHRVCALEGCDEPVTHDFPHRVAKGQEDYYCKAHRHAARRQRVLVVVTCKRCDRVRELPSYLARRHKGFCSNRCTMLYRHEHEIATKGLLTYMKEAGLLKGLRAQQRLGRVKGREAAQAAGRVGGSNPIWERAPGLAANALRLLDQNPKLGRGRLATQTGLSEEEARWLKDHQAIARAALGLKSS